MSNLKKQLTLQQLLKEVLNEVGDLAGIKSYGFKYDRSSYEGKFLTSESDQVVMFIQDITDVVQEYEEFGLVKIPPVFRQTGKSLSQNTDVAFFDIGYNVNGTDTQFRKTDLRQLVRILKTVLEFAKVAVVDVMEDVGEKTVFIVSSQAKDTEESKPDPQKDALYRSIILQNLPPGFRTAELVIREKPAILFQKK